MLLRRTQRRASAGSWRRACRSAAWALQHIRHQADASPAAAHAQGMLLRRTKATRIDGEPVVDLPQRSVVLRRIAFSPSERAFYDCLQKESASQLKVRPRAADFPHALLLQR